MAAARSVTLRLEKASVIAQLELQRANIADTWRETTQPVASIEHAVHSMARHSWAVGGIAAVGGLLLAVGGNFWLMRKAMKIALFAVPYLISHRKSGAVGFVWSLAKKLAFRWF
jgi:hypothetical protein